MATQSTNDRCNSTTKSQDRVFTHIRHALENLQFGTVTIVVQNGRVVQIERHEKLRMISNDPARPTAHRSQIRIRESISPRNQSGERENVERLREEMHGPVAEHEVRT